jgi:hypothetical protein
VLNFAPSFGDPTDGRSDAMPALSSASRQSSVAGRFTPSRRQLDYAAMRISSSTSIRETWSMERRASTSAISWESRVSSQAITSVDVWGSRRSIERLLSHTSPQEAIAPQPSKRVRRRRGELHIALDVPRNIGAAFSTHVAWAAREVARAYASRARELPLTRTVAISLFCSRRARVTALMSDLRAIGRCGFTVEVSVYRSGEDDEQSTDIVKLGRASNAPPMLYVVTNHVATTRAQRAAREVADSAIVAALAAGARHVAIRTSRSQAGFSLPAAGLARAARGHTFELEVGPARIVV